MADFVLEPGATVSHFRLERKLGEGGMGAVYLAEDLTLSRRVAIKFMSRALLAQVGAANVREAIEKRFIREARSAAAINHPNLAQIYEANFDSENWYIAMEYINGRSLESFVNPDNPVAVQAVINFTRQTCEGLKFAWNNYSIIHRDIKPGNIMVTGDQAVKIVDLGLAKPMTTAEEDAELPDITCAGTPIGTPQYMAPEQATGEKDVDFRADIFALGATIYEVLTGQKCFQERTAALIYMAQMQQRYKRAIEIRPDIPHGLSDLLDAMLQPSAMERIETYDHVIAWLDSLKDDGVDLDQTMIANPDDNPYMTGDAPTVADAVVLTGGGHGRGGAREIPTAYYPNDHLIQERYRVIRPIGKSRAGHVYLCTDTQLGVEVAVKTLYPGREFAAGQMQLIRENFQKLLSISNPHLVQIRDLSTDPETDELYVVMELLRGQNLRQWTHKKVTELGNLKIADIRPVLMRIASALDSVNQTLGTIHHDLKPESIYLTDDDRVILLDYGITTMPLPETSRVEGSRIPLDAMPLGNPDYMPPEQWTMSPTTLQTDQYALGVITYELLSHKLPFWMRDPAIEAKAQKAKDERPLLHIQLEHQFDRVMRDTPAPLPTLTRAENAVLAKAMAKKPQDRYPTSQAFAQALCGRGGSGMGKVIAIAAIVALLAGGAAVAAIAAGGGDKPTGPGTDLVENPPKNWLPPLNTDDTQPVDAGNPNNANNNGDSGNQNDPNPPIAAIDTPNDPPAVDPEQAAALDAKMRESIQRLALQYQEQRGVLTKEGLATEQVKGPDAIAARAHAQAQAGELRESISTYKEAVAAVIDEISALEKRRLTETRALAKTVAAHREKLRAFDELDQEIIQQVASYERNYRDGDRSLRGMKFTEAQASFREAEKSLATIETLLSDKFTPREGHDFTVPGVGMQFVWIQSMRIWVAKYEVTNGEYRVFRDTHTSRETEDGLSLDGERQPACRMSYYHAVEFCNWMTNNMSRLKLLPTDFSFRLPTKPEWIHFACEGEERLYPWGNDWPPKYGNFGNEEVFPTGFSLQPYTDPYPVTCPVEKSGKNGWGLYGTAGNVWEWTSTPSGTNRFVFGASWTVVSKRVLEVDPNQRNIADPGTVDYDNIGFRVILAPKAEHD